MSIALFAFAGFTMLCITVMVLRYMRHKREIREKKMDHKAEQDKRYDQMVLDDQDVPAVESGPSKDEVRDVVREELQSAQQPSQTVQHYHHGMSHRPHPFPGHLELTYSGTRDIGGIPMGVDKLCQHPRFHYLTGNRIHISSTGYKGEAFVRDIDISNESQGIRMRVEMEVPKSVKMSFGGKHDVMMGGKIHQAILENHGRTIIYRQSPIRERTEFEKRKNVDWDREIA